MLLNAKLNDTAQKMLWIEAVHTCKFRRNIMKTTGITTSPFENFHKEKSKIIGLFSEFGCIGYVTKWYKFKNQMTDKTFKAIKMGYDENHTRDTYKLYNSETKGVIMTRNVKWMDWNINDPADTLKMFREAEKEDLVPGIEENVIPTSKPEENIHVHVILDEEEKVRLNKVSEKSSELMYLKKDADEFTEELRYIVQPKDAKDA